MDHPVYNFRYLASLLVQGVSVEELAEFIHEAAIAQLAAGTVFDDTTHTEDIEVIGYDSVKNIAVVSCRGRVREVGYDRNDPDPY